MERLWIEHPLLPVYDARSRVLLLGTMPSPVSRERAFYYAHPQNRFWPVLAALFEEPCPQTREERYAFALSHRIALWDVLAQCSIEGAQDQSIRDPRPNDLAKLLQQTEIQAIFATGQAAGKLYRSLCQAELGREIVVLPSTSAANCAMRPETLVERYRVLLPYLTP